MRRLAAVVAQRLVGARGEEQRADLRVAEGGGGHQCSHAVARAVGVWGDSLRQQEADGRGGVADRRFEESDRRLVAGVAGFGEPLGERCLRRAPHRHEALVGGRVRRPVAQLKLGGQTNHRGLQRVRRDRTHRLAAALRGGRCRRRGGRERRGGTTRHPTACREDRARTCDGQTINEALGGRPAARCAVCESEVRGDEGDAVCLGEEADRTSPSEKEFTAANHIAWAVAYPIASQ
mmetsp:Transcript_31028/g.75377  ORF Transcript_31028/g.75377 Transcript_31028/m.75377 type:complete len:235 (+) Transcript_31028:1242-1946(+)